MNERGYDNLRNIAPASQFVIRNENTSDDVPDGYWDDCATRGVWDPRPRPRRTPTAAPADKCYVGQSKHLRGSHCEQSFSPRCAHAGIDGTQQAHEGNLFLYDSGANINCCRDRSMFVNYKPTKSLRAVQDASSKAHQAVGYGEVWVEVQCRSGETKILRIERVLHIPTFAVNILSETWVRSAGFGYWAPPWWLGKARIQAYDRGGKISDGIRLQPKGGLGFRVRTGDEDTHRGGA